MNSNSAKFSIPCHRPFAYAAWSLFVVSFFLPAFYDQAGWRCAYLPITIFFETIKGTEKLSLLSLHTMALMVVNLFMIASPLILVCPARSARTSFWLRRCSWAALFLTATYILQAGADARQFKIGYYVWVTAFGLLSVSLVRGGAVREIPAIS